MKVKVKVIPHTCESERESDHPPEQVAADNSQAGSYSGSPGTLQRSHVRTHPGTGNRAVLTRTQGPGAARTSLAASSEGGGGVGSSQ